MYRRLRLLITAFLMFTGLLAQVSVALETATQGTVLRLATTTSVESSELLSHLLPDFQRQTGIQVEVLAVGTGQALAIGRRGDADLLITHSPSAEQKLIDDGVVITAYPLMHNRFLLVGPIGDQANIMAITSIDKALSQIANSKQMFISRGDNSGTHMKEVSLWRKIMITPDWSGYLSAGQGMSASLRMANELSAYTLTDRGSWLAHRHQLDNLQAFSAAGTSLYNPYRILMLNPEGYSHLNFEAAETFSQWLLSDTVQKKIGQFSADGLWLFCPANKQQRMHCE
ncbi:Tungstate-binding protein TupA [Sinobacterium norvegicum]|uniref:Tungstate-binding protein TupA n=1 Tax=Sinobacterium norvegicum TaxID=1641715 RepID=A0ABN8EK35_9GAMM|nr:substrate-binding domain-containing protein [Sinobacterium norvegicum]CAH0992750.1 Tungstate-binding protein TupA [Sinobacterium norvegicum]